MEEPRTQQSKGRGRQFRKYGHRPSLLGAVSPSPLRYGPDATLRGASPDEHSLVHAGSSSFHSRAWNGKIEISSLTGAPGEPFAFPTWGSSGPAGVAAAVHLKPLADVAISFFLPETNFVPTTTTTFVAVRKGNDVPEELSGIPSLLRGRLKLLRSLCLPAPADHVTLLRERSINAWGRGPAVFSPFPLSPSLPESLKF